MAGKRRRSKKRSAASSISRPPEQLIFFLDASLGGHTIAEALRESGAAVITHNERFDQGTPDEIWLTEAGLQGWIVLSKDRRIRHNEIEWRAIVQHEVGAFILTSGNLTGAKMAEAFTRALPKMYRTVKNTRRPFLATIGLSGTVTLYRTRSR